MTDINERRTIAGGPDRYDVIGCRITRANMSSAIRETEARIQSGKGGYICFTNVHASVMGRTDENYLNALNGSFMTLPDGKPLYWVAHTRSLDDVGHVPGPDFMPRFIESTADLGLRHYFFGSTPEVLETLTEKLTENFPGIQIAGSFSPPFRQMSPDETAQVLQRIKDSAPDIVWIGLGAPKQELWMREHWEALKPAILMGVGAAFDFHAGSVRRAPGIYTRLGLEWAYRLCKEPRRLWKRYLVTNTLFIRFLLGDWIARTPGKKRQ